VERSSSQLLPPSYRRQRALAVIPNNPSRALNYPLDRHLYGQRQLVERCFSKLKQFWRVATRFERPHANYRAVITLAAIILWMR
jgi:transposase